MATVRDGIKIGVGLILLKWILGAAGCAVTVGVVTCIMLAGDNDDSAKRDSYSYAASPATRARAARPPTRSSVSFPGGCNLRERPSAQSTKLGHLPAGALVQVVGRKGRWWRVQIPGGEERWAGCRTRTKMVLKSRPPRKPARPTVTRSSWSR